MDVKKQLSQKFNQFEAVIEAIKELAEIQESGSRNIAKIGGLSHRGSRVDTSRDTIAAVEEFKDELITFAKMNFTEEVPETLIQLISSELSKIRDARDLGKIQSIKQKITTAFEDESQKTDRPNLIANIQKQANVLLVKILGYKQVCEKFDISQYDFSMLTTQLNQMRDTAFYKDFSSDELLSILNQVEEKISLFVQQVETPTIKIALEKQKAAKEAEKKSTKVEPEQEVEDKKITLDEDEATIEEQGVEEQSVEEQEVVEEELVEEEDLVEHHQVINEEPVVVESESAVEEDLVEHHQVIEEEPVLVEEETAVEITSIEREVDGQIISTKGDPTLVQEESAFEEDLVEHHQVIDEEPVVVESESSVEEDLVEHHQVIEEEPVLVEEETAVEITSIEREVDGQIISTKGDPTLVQEETVTQEPVIQTQKLDKKDSFENILSLYAQINKDYYSIQGKKSEEDVRRRRNINAQFKTVLRNHAKDQPENENGEDFSKTIQSIENGEMFKDSELEEVAKDSAASIKLFEIMARGVYEKDGQKYRLTQKQRLALATTLEKISEIRLDLDNKKALGSKIQENNLASQVEME